VFANLEEVAFVYSENREAITAQKVLQQFHGVLVSDFYAGYDSISCTQQKCLIHLMRDVKGGVKVSRCGGGKGDHFFPEEAVPSDFGGGWSGALRRPLGRRV